MKDTKKLGINCKERDGMINVGIHLDTFLQLFKPNAKGWVNFGIIKRDEKSEEGYTHKPIQLTSGQ
jgi:hypothetical protein